MTRVPAIIFFSVLLLSYSQACARSRHTPAYTHVAYELDAPRREDLLLKAFEEKMCFDHQLPLDPAELRQDLAAIRLPLSKLLSFTALHPEKERTLMERTLMRCLRVLAKKENGWAVAHSPKALKLHEKALRHCRAHFSRFCRTPEEEIKVGEHLHNIGVYYAPFATVFPAAWESLPSDRYNKKTIALCATAGAIALGTIATLSFLKRRRAP